MKIKVTRDRLKELRDLGLTRQQIADELHTSLATCKRLLTLHGLTNTRPARISEPRQIEDRSPEAGMTVLERAKMRLGDRMQRTPKGYTLDGRLVSSFDLIRAAGLGAETP